MRRFYVITVICLLIADISAYGQKNAGLCKPTAANSIFLRSAAGYNGTFEWQIKKAGDVSEGGKEISSRAYRAAGWLPAIVPGTVLNSLVYNKVYPEPYFGDNNRKTKGIIPDIADAGKEFYHYWFRTEFKVPSKFAGKRIWLKLHGINYRADLWVNGKSIGNMSGMFNSQSFDITSITDLKNKNVLAVSVRPVDEPGNSNKASEVRLGAIGENRNGGNGEIGKNVTMLMSVGWDFTAPDGIRDRNTGIWRDVELYSTGDVGLEHPFVQTSLPLPDTSFSEQTVSVEVVNFSSKPQAGRLTGMIKETNTLLAKNVTLGPGERKLVSFSPAEFKQLKLKHPQLWWPINKGKQNLYTLSLSFLMSGKTQSHSITTRFGIREITSDQNTPDKSRRFLVNGVPIFIRGTNWVPEAMLRNSEDRTYAELRYTRQAGVNLLRLWGGGTTESDYFYQLCDELGFLVWNEFWLTGDTRFPADTALYFKNVESTVKRIRNHPSVARYVSSNESTEVPGASALFHKLDSTIGYQMQSECCGVHDGSPYKYENPMQYFENTASARGSRVDGFNPEYGTPCLPTVESLKEMMPEKDLWPINDSVWNYLDGGGFHQMTTKYRQAVDEFGQSKSIEEFAKKAQFVGALNYRAIWEVWNYNKFNYGDRFASGFLFWYHNSPLPQVAGRMYDWSLQPTAALYYSQNGLAPLHPQFDYLKNTVSVYNDYRQAFAHYSVEAMVYDLNSTLILTKKAGVYIPADGVVNDVFKIDFPEDISSVHFIKLRLIDDKGRVINDAFYWRSGNRYKGAWSMTGPATAGFQELNKLPKVSLNIKADKIVAKEKLMLDVTITNPGTALSFFTELKLQDDKGRNIKPAYFSDNFFSLLPGESKKITIEVRGKKLINSQLQLVLDGWNAVTQKVTLREQKNRLKD